MKIEIVQMKEWNYLMNKVIPDFVEITDYEMGSYPRDYHGVVSVQLAELIDTNFVIWYTENKELEQWFPNPDWVWDYYSLEQYKRVCDKFNARYMFDEVSLMPPGIWKQQVIRKFNEVMPKYKLLYKIIDDNLDPIQVAGKYGKSRSIYSEFPETLLNGNSDYVSNGRDNEYEDIETGNWLEQYAALVNNYQDVDVYLLDEFENLFSSLYSVNINGF